MSDKIDPKASDLTNVARGLFAIASAVNNLANSVKWLGAGDDIGDGRGALREDDVKERLGERIRRRRAEHKLGLRETATKVGISPTYLSRIETMDEKTPPAEDVIRKLATLLNDDFDELMQLAGRVPEDVEKVIKGDPSMPAFLRTAKEQKLSGDDLMKLIEAQKKGKRRSSRGSSK